MYPTEPDAMCKASYLARQNSIPASALHFGIAGRKQFQCLLSSGLLILSTIWDRAWYHACSLNFSQLDPFIIMVVLFLETDIWETIIPALYDNLLCEVKQCFFLMQSY
jgi:hypothetical protein